jgi:hypothetical protein
MPPASLMMPAAAVSRPAACGAPPLIDSRNSTRGWLVAFASVAASDFIASRPLAIMASASATLPVALPTAAILVITLS